MFHEDLRRHSGISRFGLFQQPHRPLHHLPAQPGAALRRRDPDRLDLSAPGSQPGDAGNEAQLEGADDHPLPLGHRQKLVRIGRHRAERLKIARVERDRRILAAAAQAVVGDQGDNGRQVFRPRGPERDRVSGHAAFLRAA
jgi:hypothetical protein